MSSFLDNPTPFMEMDDEAFEAHINGTTQEKLAETGNKLDKYSDEQLFGENSQVAERMKGQRFQEKRTGLGKLQGGSSSMQDHFRNKASNGRTLSGMKGSVDSPNGIRMVANGLSQDEQRQVLAELNHGSFKTYRSIADANEALELGMADEAYNSYAEALQVHLDFIPSEAD